MLFKNRNSEGCTSPQVSLTIFFVSMTSLSIFATQLSLFRLCSDSQRRCLIWFGNCGNELITFIRPLFQYCNIVLTVVFISPLSLAASLLWFCADWWLWPFQHVSLLQTAETSVSLHCWRTLEFKQVTSLMDDGFCCLLFKKKGKYNFHFWPRCFSY